MARKQPGRNSSNITLISMALARAISMKTLLHQQRNSSVSYRGHTAFPRLIHATKHESSCFVSVVHKRLCHQHQMQQSFTFYQASVWNQAHSPYHDLPPVTDIMGWMHVDGRLVPRMLSLSPIPKVCWEITTCGCTKGCLIQCCSCRKLGDNYRNTHDDQE